MRLKSESRTIAAVDLYVGEQFELVIDAIDWAKVRDLADRQRRLKWMPVAWYSTPEGVPLSKFMPLVMTNRHALRRISGSNEPEKWEGQTVMLMRLEEVHYGVPGCIRLRGTGEPVPRTLGKFEREAREAVAVLGRRADGEGPVARESPDTPSPAAAPTRSRESSATSAAGAPAVAGSEGVTPPARRSMSGTNDGDEPI